MTLTKRSWLKVESLAYLQGSLNCTLHCVNAQFVISAAAHHAGSWDLLSSLLNNQHWQRKSAELYMADATFCTLVRCAELHPSSFIIMDRGN